MSSLSGALAATSHFGVQDARATVCRTMLQESAGTHGVRKGHLARRRPKWGRMETRVLWAVVHTPGSRLGCAQ